MHRRPQGILALGLILALAAGAAAQAPALGSPPSDLAAPASDLVSPPSAPAPLPDAPKPIIYPAGSEPQPDPSPVRWDGATAILGDVRLDSATKTVTATGWVNQIDGAIEVFACGLQGKVHESAFVLALNPLDLQAALLLAGLKGGDPMPAIGEGPPQGDPVDVFVDWIDGDEAKTARAESFLWHVGEKAPLPETPWIFTGSVVKDGRFMAFAEESLVVTYWDPYALVNLPLPCGANDELVHVNPDAIPPFRTPVSFRFVPR